MLSNNTGNHQDTARADESDRTAEAAFYARMAWGQIGFHQNILESNKHLVAEYFGLDGDRERHKISMAVMPTGDNMFRPCLVVDLKGKYTDDVPADMEMEIAVPPGMSYAAMMCRAARSTGITMLAAASCPDLRRLANISVCVYV